jgi:hypothetical protein
MEDIFYYYLILFSTVLISFSFITLLTEVRYQQMTSNIPYLFLIFFILAYSILIGIAIIKRYVIHSIFYLLILVTLIVITILKHYYDQNNSTIYFS